VPLKKTHSEFISELTVKNKHYREGKFDVIGLYKGVKDKIEVRNKYGVCVVTPDTLLQGTQPNINSAKNPSSYFINRAKEVHGNKYDYSSVVYTNSNSKVIINCPKHGNFKQAPSIHLHGYRCKKCGEEACGIKLAESTDGFIRKAKKVHGDKYFYDKVNYINNSTKVEIICEKHGVFTQIPYNHLKGYGCKKCVILEGRRSLGFSPKSWLESAEKSPNFDSFKLYIIKCWNDEEVFYKVGITYTTIEKRFKRFPYKYTVALLYEGRCDDMFKLEKSIHRRNKSSKYIPKKRFDGYTECFSEIDWMPFHYMD